MGLFDSLFEKKYCDICGEEIGLFGSRKVTDGCVCSKCTGKLSPYFTERKNSTVQDIKEQLEYREVNRQQLANFNPDYIVDGSEKQVRVDQNMGCFIVYDGEDWINGNPDLIPLEDVINCSVDIQEREEEIQDKDSQGHYVHRNPREYKYEYSFYVTIDLNHPYISRICYEMTHFARRPQSPYEDLFTYNVDEANALYKILTGKTFSVKYSRFRYREPIIHQEQPKPAPQRQTEPRPMERKPVETRKPQGGAPEVGMHNNPANHQPLAKAMNNNSQPADNSHPQGTTNSARPSLNRSTTAAAQPVTNKTNNQPQGSTNQATPNRTNGQPQSNTGRPAGSNNQGSQSKMGGRH